jgi:hypothetical protein
VPSAKYTVVQHSGYGYASNPEFKYGLEERALTTPSQVKRVESVGGVVLDGYVAASELAEKWNYPPTVRTLAPDCSSLGTFSKKMIDGLAIFIPTDEARRGIE